MFSTWLSVLSTLLTMRTDWFVTAASSPAWSTVNVTVRVTALPVATAPQLLELAPSPDRRGSVMPPPANTVCTAPRSAGPLLPVFWMS